MRNRHPYDVVIIPLALLFMDRARFIRPWLKSLSFRISYATLGCFLLCSLCSVASAQDPTSRITASKKVAVALPAFTSNAFSPVTNEVIVWVGQENTVIEQENGWIEESLLRSLQSVGHSARVRYMAWEGDTVYRQNRMMNWGSWQENLSAVDATTVFVEFGGMEALQKERSTADFIDAYEKLLDEFAKQTKRIVLITPTPFEKPQSPLIPDHTSENARLKECVAGLKRMADRRNCLLVDLFTPLSNRPKSASTLTRDGIHLTSEGLKELAPLFLKGLGLSSKGKTDEATRLQVIRKNHIWFDIWRPMNWAFAYGDRTTQPFAQQAEGHPPFAEELKRNLPLLEHAEASVLALVAHTPLPVPLPEEPPRADPAASTPEEEKSRFKLRAGFSINLFADEKMGVVRPVQIRWDERGRLWVVCAPSYPQLLPGEKANDYILVLEDTNGDGVADKVTRFAEGLKMPMGLEFGPDGVFVCESTKLIYLQDTDGDGKADQRTVIFSGFGTGDSHQDINSIRWGADGHLWFTQGYHIWSYVETPHGIVELNRSGIWRLNPRTLKLESFLNENGAGLNCWGVTFDDYGQLFHASGADFAIWHSTPALVNTLQPLNLGSGFAISKGKSTEPEFLGSSALPDDLHGVLLKSIFFTSEVGLYRLKANGSGYLSEDIGDLISSSNPEFRPLETRMGPDGAIYICDWLNPVIGHYQASYRDPRRDHSHGRIWRMTANGKQSLVRPPLETMNISQLLDQLHSPERWNRDQAKFVLYRKPAGAVISEVEKKLKTSKLEESFLYELSGILLSHEKSSPAVIEKLLQSPDFRWRAWGTHLAGLWSSNLSDPLSYIRKSMTDTNARVRMEAVVAASHVPKSEAVKLATLVLDQSSDPEIDYALTLCIHALAPYWRPDLASGKLDFGDRFDALARVVSTMGDTNLVTMLRHKLESGKVTGPAREKLLSVMVENGGIQEMIYAQQEAPQSSLVLDSLVKSAESRKKETSPALLQALFVTSSPASRVAGARIAASWGDSAGQLTKIESMVTNTASTDAEKESGAFALAKLKHKAAWSEILPLSTHPSPKVQLAALSALASMDPQAAAVESSKILARSTSPSQAGIAISTFLNINNGSLLLSVALQKQSISPESATAALQWLSNNGRDDFLLVDVLRKAAGLDFNHLEYSEKLVRDLVDDAQKLGDAKAG
ncbi:MAG: putative rane-bound dehydrogenase protein, partial [Verrucomicrobiales bacterium]|nr:putative rane-bound dehydrogenase protein [Verrucomicrobiales bacterium]